LVTPFEEFANGYINVSDRPGFGFQLNHAEVAKHI